MRCLTVLLCSYLYYNSCRNAVVSTRPLLRLQRGLFPPFRSTLPTDNIWGRPKETPVLKSLGSLLYIAPGLSWSSRSLFSTKQQNRNTLLKGLAIDDGPRGLVQLGDLTEYCTSLQKTERFPTRTVNVGKVLIGSKHPIVSQTMTTSDTRDVDASVEQVERCADAGADIVRLTVQGVKEAEAGLKIKEKLLQRNCETPLVADIHFNPRAAMKVCEAFDKIRVNPGNYVDGVKNFDEKVYNTYEQFEAGRAAIATQLVPLIEKLKRLNRALRIGTNHGSLSSRITSYYGDTPRGMVESALEFAEICRENDFHNFVFSMKSSNAVVMVQAYRLLVAAQMRKKWDYPIHLGVTEAGEGEDGRIKSAIGIGSLLQDGIGDTIRVSLTEDPWFELQPCRQLARMGHEKANDWERQMRVPEYDETTRDFKEFHKRPVTITQPQGKDPAGANQLFHRDGSVISVVSPEDFRTPQSDLFASLGCKLVDGVPYKDIATSDSIYLSTLPSVDNVTDRNTLRRLQEAGVGVLAPIQELQKSPIDNVVPVAPVDRWVSSEGEPHPLPLGTTQLVLHINGKESEEQLKAVASADRSLVLGGLLEPDKSIGHLQAARRVFEYLKRENSTLPIIHCLHQPGTADVGVSAMRYGMEVGALLVDGLGDGVMFSGGSIDEMRSVSFSVLQGCRMRRVKTEFISCPSCGRTLFDLQTTVQEIRKRVGHLPGVAIAVMGCIVNGPGEMADADFGYVGGKPGHVDLYVGKQVVERGIPNELATDKLIELIKQHGRWEEPPS